MTSGRQHNWSETRMNRLNVLLDKDTPRDICASTLGCSTATITARTKDLVREGKRPAGRKAIENPWTPGMNDKLMDMVRNRPELTRKQMGKVLGVSKNAVIGRVHRLQSKGVLPPPKRTRPQRRKRTRSGGASEAAARRSRLLQNHYRQTGGDRQPRTAEELAESRQQRARKRAGLKTSGIAGKLLALRNNQCRFIEGNPTSADSTYCEADQLRGYSYCQEHKTLCTVVPRGH